MQTTNVIFACDESGAKGYADQDERFSGEVGVFAGILMPEECFAQKIPMFQAVQQKYVGHSEKLHIADLVPAEKEALRSDMYDAIRKSQLPCFWYAIHVAGLHRRQRELDRLYSKARNNRHSSVKPGSTWAAPLSLHVELFSGLYGHLIAFCEERHRQELDVEIRLDSVDKPIAKNFEGTAEKLLALDATVTKGTGYDPVTETVLHGQVRSAISVPKELAINATIRSLRLNVMKQPDGLVLAADVLANSLAHLFHNRKEHERYRSLNSREAIANHPLAPQLDAFSDWGSRDLVGDGLYRHPKDPGLICTQPG